MISSTRRPVPARGDVCAGRVLQLGLPDRPGHCRGQPRPRLRRVPEGQDPRRRPPPHHGGVREQEGRQHAMAAVAVQPGEGQEALRQARMTDGDVGWCQQRLVLPYPCGHLLRGSLGLFELFRLK